MSNLSKRNKIVVGGVVAGVIVLGGVGYLTRDTSIQASYYVDEFCEKSVTVKDFESENKQKYFELKGNIAKDDDIKESLKKITFTSSIKNEKSGQYLKIECLFDDKSDLEKVGANYDVTLSGKFVSVLSNVIRFSECKLISYRLAEQPSVTTIATTSVGNVTSAQETDPPKTEPEKTEPEKTDPPATLAPIETDPPALVVTTSSNSGQQITKEYVLNTKSKVIHKPSCRHVDDIAEENYSTTTDYNWAISQGYRACKTCSPF